MKGLGLLAFVLAAVIIAAHFQTQLGILSQQVHSELFASTTPSSNPLLTKKNAFIAAAAAHADDPLTLGQRTKKSACEIQGPLPDSDCTPGSVFASATPSPICVEGYTKTVRNVTADTKRKVYGEYGLSYPQPSGSYEVDHLIPLELGGNNSISNLFPEAASPKPGFHEKDLVENFLHNEVCSGDISLAYAQQTIATNWLEVWNALTPEQIKFLKHQYTN